MANRVYFTFNEEEVFVEKEAEFVFYNGFSLIQKQKSIISFHNAIKEPSKKVIDISTKSPNDLGIKLSAFNLLYKINDKEYPLENVFQSAKVFDNGGPYLDMLLLSPYEVKKDIRLKTSGKLVCFKLNGIEYPLEPKTLFYDWVYCNALFCQKDLAKEIVNYNCFTDIEYNHKKSINCQARSVAIFVSLYKKGLLEYALESIENFIKVVYKNNQLSFNLF